MIDPTQSTSDTFYFSAKDFSSESPELAEMVRNLSLETTRLSQSKINSLLELAANRNYLSLDEQFYIFSEILDNLLLPNLERGEEEFAILLDQNRENSFSILMEIITYKTRAGETPFNIAQYIDAVRDYLSSAEGLVILRESFRRYIEENEIDGEKLYTIKLFKTLLKQLSVALEKTPGVTFDDYGRVYINSLT